MLLKEGDKLLHNGRPCEVVRSNPLQTMLGYENGHTVVITSIKVMHECRWAGEKPSYVWTLFGSTKGPNLGLDEDFGYYVGVFDSLDAAKNGVVKEGYEIAEVNERYTYSDVTVWECVGGERWYAAFRTEVLR